MTSVQSYNGLKDLIDKDTNGNITPAVFVTLFNIVQLKFQRKVFDDMGPDFNTRIINMMSPFRTPTSNILLDPQGIGIFNTGDFAFGPYLFVSLYFNPACGEVAAEALETPVEPVSNAEWSERTRSQYKGPTIEFPIFRPCSMTEVEVRPKTVRAVWSYYYRLPTPITLNTANGYPTGLGDTDPEWNDLDIAEILMGVVWSAGLREQMPSWMAAGNQLKSTT
jgi:hypothetical protein